MYRLFSLLSRNVKDGRSVFSRLGQVEVGQKAKGEFVKLFGFCNV